MELWSKLLQNQESLNILRSTYRQPFSIEVRHAIASWIEKKFIESRHLNPENSEDSSTIDLLILQMADEIENKARPESAPLIFESKDIRDHLIQAARHIRAPSTNRKKLFCEIRHYLNFEHNRLATMEAQAREPSNNVLLELRTSFDNFDNFHLKEAREALKHLKQAQNEFMANLGQPIHSDFNAMVERHDKELQLGNFDNQLNQQIQNCCHQFEFLLSRLLGELENWKLAMRNTYTGKSVQAHIEPIHLNYFFNKLACYFWEARNLIREAATLKITSGQFGLSSSDYAIGNTMQLDNFRLQVEKMLKTLVSNSLIIINEPNQPSNQMIKTGTKFKSLVQFLIGEQIKVLPQIKVSLLKESDAEAIALQSTTQIPTNSSQDIEDNMANVETAQDGQYYASFRNCKIQESFKRIIDPKVRKLSQSVLDVNYFLYYSAQFQYDGIMFNVGALSYPVKIIKNVSQEEKSWETAIWDLATSSLNPGQTLVERKSVQWIDFAQALSVWFYKQTGCGLENENLEFIVNKLLPENLAEAIKADPSTHFSLNEFTSPDLISGKDFSLWKWIFDVREFITDHLRGEKKIGAVPYGVWDQGYIWGMVSSERTSEELQAYGKDGGFLARFSPNTIATITIEWIEGGDIFCTRLTYKDLTKRSLANRISDINKWKVVLSSKNKPTPKDDVFVKEPEFINHPIGPKPTCLGSNKSKIQYVKNILKNIIILPTSTTSAIESAQGMGSEAVCTTMSFSSSSVSSMSML